MRKTSTKKKTAITTTLIFLVISGAYMYWRSVYSPIPNKVSVDQNGVFEEVPTNYSECMRTDEKYNSQQRDQSDLKCEFLVSGGVTGQNFSKEDKIKFDKCKQMGGKNLLYEVSCGLIFYNPNFVFPKSFEECVSKKKGEFTTSVKPRCMVQISTSLAKNTSAANNLINQCIALGGSYSEQFGRNCYIEFEQ